MNGDRSPSPLKPDRPPPGLLEERVYSRNATDRERRRADVLKSPVVTLGVIALSISSGCAQSHLYQGVKYETPDAMLKAQRVDIDLLVSNINPTSHPVGGRTLFVVPTRESLKKRSTKYKKIRGKPKRVASLSDAELSSLEINFAAFAQFMEKRQIFDEVSVVKSDVPESVTSSKHEFVLFYTFTSEVRDQLFSLTASSNDEVVPIGIDTSVPHGMPRILSWLDTLEEMAAHLARAQIAE